MRRFAGPSLARASFGNMDHSRTGTAWKLMSLSLADPSRSSYRKVFGVFFGQQRLSSCHCGLVSAIGARTTPEHTRTRWAQFEAIDACGVGGLPVSRLMRCMQARDVRVSVQKGGYGMLSSLSISLSHRLSLSLPLCMYFC